MQPSRRPALVYRRPGLLAALITLVVGTVAVTIALTAPDRAPAAVPAPAAETTPARPEVRDDVLGVSFDLPDGWTAGEGPGIYNISSSASLTRPDGSNALVAVGLLDTSLFAGSSEPTPTDAARRLANDWGEFAIPVPGRRTEPVDAATTLDGRAAWESGYRVVPEDPAADGGDVRTTVVEDGERRLYVLVLVSPGDEELLAQARSVAATLRFG